MADVGKLKVEKRITDGFKIIANRVCLAGLAEICLRLARLSEDSKQAKKLGTITTMRRGRTTPRRRQSH